jgi:hypothetical protein
MKFRYENAAGGGVSFTERDSVIRLLSVDGITSEVDIRFMPYYDSDGGAVISSRLGSRRITLHTAFCGDYALCRKIIQDVFVPKLPGSLIYEDDFKTVYKIACLTENVRMPITERAAEARISLFCADPYWSAAAEKSVTALYSAAQWTFPWELPETGFRFSENDRDRIARIVNGGATPGGCVFEIYARANVLKPSLQNINTFDRIELDVALAAGDRVIIDTNKGRKSVKLVRDGISRNIINHITPGSVFLQLDTGLNEIVCAAQSGLSSMSLKIRFSERFGGV